MSLFDSPKRAAFWPNLILNSGLLLVRYDHQDELFRLKVAFRHAQNILLSDLTDQFRIAFEVV
jgi:hypothetical protein